MSKLKDQLKLIMPKLSEQANRNQDKEVKFRLYALKAIVDSKKDVKHACEMKGVSTDFFYEWGNRLFRSNKLSSLKSKSRRPKRSPNKTPLRVEKRIRKLRRAEPSHGSERISFYLKNLFNVSCPPGTVFNVLKRLGFVCKAKRKTRSKKHLKRYRRPVPGYLQMDVKFVPYMIEGKQYYEFNAVDHHSSWRLIRAYQNKSYESLDAFLAELEKECPFAIIQIQTDNGSEFTDKYRINSDGFPTGKHHLDVWCTVNEVEHKLIPVGVKELNGKVENTHGFDDREFYSQGALILTYKSLEINMRGWNDRWNNSRHTKTLGWRTPNQVVEAAQVRYLAYLQLWAEQAGSLAKLNDNAVFDLKTEILPAPKPRKIKTPKKLTAVDRYLAWIEGEEKKSLKSIIAVPAMSQILPSKMKIKMKYGDSFDHSVAK
jgi:transposase InsO family protein